MGHVKTTDKQYVRDTNSNALLNTDSKALEQHRKRRITATKMSSLPQQIDDLTRRVAYLEELITRIISDGK